MSNYEQSERLKSVADKVIESNAELLHLKDPACRIGYQTSDQAKKRNGGATIVYADTMLVSEKLKAFIPYDFIITFYWPNCETLSPEKLERLMYHELRHVGFADGKMYIVPHDIEDFRSIIDTWGFDWL